MGLFSGKQEFEVSVWFDSFAAPFIRVDPPCYVV
jgi:hypothetical protein